MHIILSSMIAQTGMQLKVSEKIRHSLTEYLRLHSSKNPGGAQSESCYEQTALGSAYRKSG
jgi:hypothetical protein